MRFVITIGNRSVSDRPEDPGLKPRRLVLAKWRPWVVLGTLTVVAAILGASVGRFARLDMPSLSGLEEYAPAEMTRILAGDGAEIASFAAQKRIVLGYGQIPESFRLALIASEDSRFHEHAGVDPIGGLRAAWTALRQREVTQGASTLTMQLAGNLFLDRSRRTLKRKLQEIFLAFEIERRFSKQEIVRMYCNQVHFGHGLYGLEAAARHYFDKPAAELTIGESATLVGLLPRPASYSPFRNMKRATERRNLVLRRMVAEGYLSAADARHLSDEPIVLGGRDAAHEVAPYFTEQVRRRLQETYGNDELYGGGMSVGTTLDRRLQEIANRAVDAGLRQLDKRQGWRPDAVHRVPVGEDPRGWTSPAWKQEIVEGQVTDAVVLGTDRQGAEIRIADEIGRLSSESIRWTGTSRPDQLLEPGDVIRVRVLDRNGDGSLRLSLEQEPDAEAALIAIEPASGEILALVGGFDFSRSEYDRAAQARRQPGSLFKPFVYTAALTRGWTLADTLIDEPTVFLDRSRPVPYQPENFSRDYHGTVTLRAALEKSINIATVKLLERIGYDAVMETARGLGIRSPLRSYPSLALGAFELTLLEVTSAYGAFANRGLHMEPHWIRRVSDRHGRALYHAKPQVTAALSPQIAYLMNRALSGVIRSGTGRSAGAALDRTLAGKTGTTDDNTDAWFVGYSSRLVVGVWVGYDEPRSLGDRETGARAALPIWIEFMRRALEDVPEEPFAIPPGVSSVPIDPHTGKRWDVRAGCASAFEVFLQGTEPIDPCSPEIHRKLLLPYPFHRYGLDADGSLQIPGDELLRILEREPDIRLKRRRQTLEAFGPEGIVRAGLTVLPDSDLTFEPAVDGALDPSSWIGTDGRRARVVWFGGCP